MAKIILGGKKAPIVRLEGVQFIMMYKRIKTEMIFQCSLPWDVYSCLLTAWRRSCNLQLHLNSSGPSLVSVRCSSLCRSDLFSRQHNPSSRAQCWDAAARCVSTEEPTGGWSCVEKRHKRGRRSSGVRWEFLRVGVSQKWSRLVFLPPYVDRSSRISVGCLKYSVGRRSHRLGSELVRFWLANMA